jgi:hypothetical protein
MVDAEAAIRRRVASSRARSGQLHFDSGTPDSAGSAQASATASARSAAVNTGGRPLRGASFSPASRPAANRRRHLRTVSVHTPSCLAITALFLPAAAASTIWARSRSRYWVRADRTRAINTGFSSADKTIRQGLITGI